MHELDGKVAVITGAASGIGAAMARRFATDGMGLVLADVEEPVLDELVDELVTGGAEAIGVPTDVSDAGQMDRLGAAAFDRFGQVNVVCNNAGVSGSSAPVHELRTADWEWVLGVNLMGVVHGHRVFQSHLMSHGDGHIVNTASVAGLTAFSGMAPYHASKHAVLALSEVVHSELAAAGSPVGITALCPGWVSTRIAESDRNRPEQVPEPLIGEPEEQEQIRALIRDFMAGHQPPDEVAALVVDAIRERRFYLFTASDWSERIAERHADIVAARNPRPKGSMAEETT
ncbi:MAG: SDR family NAD(P)-dependent oxidoreductase [Acidimicrobiales bacterium]|nr:SDR family NAD(P)-dependent oxidoreductase [Acidimicrobiales bacterium]